MRSFFLQLCRLFMFCLDKISIFLSHEVLTKEFFLTAHHENEMFDFSIIILAYKNPVPSS